MAEHQKQGAGFGYTKRRGYHPILATRADTGEVLHARMRKGSASSQRGAERFVCELVARVRRLGASGPLSVRADSGFWSYKTIEALERHGVRYSIGVSQHATVRAATTSSPTPPGCSSLLWRTTSPAGSPASASGYTARS